MCLSAWLESGSSCAASVRSYVRTRAYLSPGRSLTDAEISAASGHSFSTSSRGPQRDLLKLRKDFFTGGTKWRNVHTSVGLWRIEIADQVENSQCLPFTFEAMFEAVLHDNKELLEGWVVRIQGSSKAQSRLDQPFDTQLGHVQQVGPLHGRGVSQSCNM